MPARHALVPAALAATIGLWAGAFVAIRAALPALGWATLASGRLLVAAVTFALLARRLGVRVPDRAQLPLLAVLGATGYTGYQLLLSAGEETVSAGASALLFAAAPVLAAVLARPLLGERMTRRGIAGLGVAVAGVAALTASERRVADMAAGGSTNRDIAQALFVTPKTVEVHLSNAYRKLGIRSRRDLAAALAG